MTSDPVNNLTGTACVIFLIIFIKLSNSYLNNIVPSNKVFAITFFFCKFRYKKVMLIVNQVDALLQGGY